MPHRVHGLRVTALAIAVAIAGTTAIVAPVAATDPAPVASPAPSPSPAPDLSAAASASPAAPAATQTATPSPQPSATAKPSASVAPTPAPTAKPSASVAPTATPAASAAPAPTPTAQPSASVAPSATPSPQPSVATTATVAAPTPTPRPAVPNIGLRVVRIALAQRGDQYRWGGQGPYYFDCSGLVRYAYRKAGVSRKLGGGSSARGMLYWGRLHGLTSTHNPRLGDVAIYGRGTHAAIWIGHGRVVHALNPRLDIRVTRLRAMTKPFTTFIHTRIPRG